MSSWAYWSILCFFSVFSTHAVYSHAVQENTAKILTRHGALELVLNIHGNQWTPEGGVPKAPPPGITNTGKKANVANETSF